MQVDMMRITLDKYDCTTEQFCKSEEQMLGILQYEEHLMLKRTI